VELDEGIERVGEFGVMGAAPTFRLQRGQNFGRETSNEDTKGNINTSSVVCENSNIFADPLRGKLEDA